MYLEYDIIFMKRDDFMYRNTYAVIDLDVLKNNIVNIKKEYPDYEYYFGVVKGNAYGHGSYIVNTLIEAGINYLAVSSLEEALDVRSYNKDIPILILEPIKIKYLDVCIENNITITLSDYSYYRELLDFKDKDKLKVHLKVETGMNRIGIDNKEKITEIVNDKKIFIEGIYTHFATSGINDRYWDMQLNNFRELTSDIDLSKIKIVHLGRSMTLTSHKKIDIANGIRLGIVMYGFNNKILPGSGIKNKLRELKNKYKRKKENISETITTNLEVNTAFSLYSEVIQVKQVKKGDIVGYGVSYILNEDAYLATVSIGYYDGVSGFKRVVINGKIYNIVGDICMDMLMVKVDSSVKVGDKVCLLGNELSVKSVCRDIHVNAYKLLTRISNRVPRIYKKDGKIIKK